LPDSIDEIAHGLTPAERGFVKMPLYSAFSEGITAAWFHATGYEPARRLAKKGLCERRRIAPGYFASIPTPLGLQVREHLQKGPQP
jgi:hypothetical protein